MQIRSKKDDKEEKLTALAKKGDKDAQFQLAIYQWKKIDPLFNGHPPKNEEDKKAIKQAIPKLKDVISLLKKIADKGYLDATRDYVALSITKSFFKWYLKNKVVEVSSAQWPVFLQAKKNKIKKLIAFIEKSGHQNDIILQSFLWPLLTSNEAKEIKRSFEIIQRLTEQGCGTAQLRLAQLIVFARKFNYSAENAKKAREEILKSKENENLYLLYHSLCFPEILNILSQFNNSSGQSYVEKLLDQYRKSEPLQTHTFVLFSRDTLKIEIEIKKVMEMASELGVTFTADKKPLSGSDSKTVLVALGLTGQTVTAKVESKSPLLKTNIKRSDTDIPASVQWDYKTQLRL